MAKGGRTVLLSGQCGLMSHAAKSSASRTIGRNSHETRTTGRHPRARITRSSHRD